MSTSTKLAKQLRRVAAEWPVDPLRPNMQLKTFMNSLAEHPSLTPEAVTAARALQENHILKKVRLPSLFSPYPLPKKIVKPASMPHHYERLVEGFEKSQKGIGRPWWKIFFGVW